MRDRIRLVTRRVDPFACRGTHPLTRVQCVIGPWGHDLHWGRSLGSQWSTDTGKTSSEVGMVYVTYFGRFVPHPGHEADDVVEHFPDPAILAHQVACRIANGYGRSFAPGVPQQTVWYTDVAPHAYMDVWVMVSPDHRVSDPVPDPYTTPPMERWTIDNTLDRESQRSAYLPLVARPLTAREAFLKQRRASLESRT